METRILAVDTSRIGILQAVPRPNDILDGLNIDLDLNAADGQNIFKAAEQLKTSDTPVAFPTETVYGLGADATRSAAVKGIYHAKQRPSDNPLIVHFASLDQLRSLLEPTWRNHDRNLVSDPIPSIYSTLIARFWPGPMTIILRNPSHAPLAPEVTAGLSTFGARMPRHPLALALIHTAGVPVAAPSANASTKPSPTAAEHVAHDLHGRIETIIDGGPCDVGVESTVVDGLSNPPLILRPGGISLEQIRACPGWERTEIGYKNVSEIGTQPRAPGMKYRHYSPKATVVLYESGKSAPTIPQIRERLGSNKVVGVVRTRTWSVHAASSDVIQCRSCPHEHINGASKTSLRPGFAGMLEDLQSVHAARSEPTTSAIDDQNGSTFELVDIDLGPDTAAIARGIFSALRDLDRRDADVIFVEGIDDDEGNTAAAIMNRLRKAAEVHV